MKFFSTVVLFTIATALTSTGFADELDFQVLAKQKMDQFKVEHPDAIFYGEQYFDGEDFFEIDGTADFILGPDLSTGESAEQSARSFCEQIEGVYAEEIGTLVSGEQLGVMWNKATGQHKFTTLRLRQTVGEIPVYRSGIGFLIRNQEGFPVVMTSNNLKEMKGFDVAGAAKIAPQATPAMIANATNLINNSGPFQGAPVIKSVLDGAAIVPAPPTTAKEEELVIWAGVTNVKVQPELAIKFIAEQGTEREPSNYRKHLIIAAVDDGEILHSVNEIVADVVGTVSGRASDGVGALECHPTNPFALPYLNVEVVGGASTFADVDGNFSLPSGDGDVTVRSSLSGQWFAVFDDTDGFNTPSIEVTTNSGTADLLHNSSPGQFGTSNINCYLHANIVRDFVLSFNPSFPIIANQTSFTITSNNDEVSGITSCNATYSGTAINFMRNRGACNNTSIPDVVYHEYGHHLVAVTGNSQGQFGEGCGDTMGVLIEDSPFLALGFFEGQCNNGIRSATNFMEYPCFDQGGPHACGQLISGCVWDTLNAIRAVDPENARDITADLFLGMLVVRGQMGGSSMIGPEITLIFLELDDDDGNIGNGTPHYDQIAAAFNAHNMMAPELEPLLISLPNGVPETLAFGGDSFEVEVVNGADSMVKGSGLLHYNDGAGFVQVPLIETGDNTFVAEFPSTCLGVEFFISVESSGGDTVTTPPNAPSDVYSAITDNPIELLFLDGFDTDDAGYSVSGNATDGQWVRAIPNNGQRGDPAFDAEGDGGGFCYVTDNGNTGGDDNTDVDDGETILTSPVLDATVVAGDTATVSYYRWYSNNAGASPNQDTFLVEISNDGGASWVELETVGPGGPETNGGWIQQDFFIADFVEPTDNMRLRFTASDLGDGSVVEAGIDRLEIKSVDCSFEEEVLVGDINRDGIVDLLDVQPFVDLILGGGFQEEADTNNDGVVDLLDITDFVALIIGG